MVNRRDLKSTHEEAVLRHFKAHLEDKGVILQVLERPEPPEAIVEIDGKRTWVEITDAFLDDAHAKSVTSAACDNVARMPDGRRLILEPDETFSNVLRTVIEKKYEKASMRAIAASRGQGVLLVGIFTPFTTAALVSQDEAVAVADLVSRKSVKVFKMIYVYDGTGEREFHILHQTEP